MTAEPPDPPGRVGVPGEAAPGAAWEFWPDGAAADRAEGGAAVSPGRLAGPAAAGPAVAPAARGAPELERAAPGSAAWDPVSDATGPAAAVAVSARPSVPVSADGMAFVSPAAGAAPGPSCAAAALRSSPRSRCVPHPA